MGIDVRTLGISKKYTDETVIGGGAIKGKNCTVDSITDITGGHRVTFKWTLDDGTEKTEYMDVMDGQDGVDGQDGAKGDKGDKGDTGKGIKSVSINAEDHLIVTYTDDTTTDAGRIEVESAVDSVNGKTGNVTLNASDVGALPNSTVIPSKTSDLTNDSNFVADASYVHTDNNYDATAKDIVDGVTSELSGKVDKETGKSLIDLTTVVDGASYDSTNHLILFKNGTTTLFSLDAAAFVKDGMVDTVTITGGNLVITFNTDAGKQAISIPITDIFDPANYYDKTATDNLLADKADKVRGATSGNLASLDANGNLTDSGSKASDFLTSHQDISGKADNSVIAPVEANSTASQAYKVGSHFIRNGAFCTVIAAIESGDALTANTNYVAWNIASLLNYLEQTAALSTSAQVTVTFVDARITTSSCVDVGVSEWGLVPDDVAVSTGSCTITFPQVTVAHSVTVRLYLR